MNYAEKRSMLQNSLCETAAVNKGFVRRYISIYVLKHGHTIITIRRG